MGNGLGADDRAAHSRSCGLTVPFPDSLKTETQLLVCYDEGVVWAFAASVPPSDPEKLHTDHAAVMAAIIEL